jgi:hypothetical protein
VHYAQRIELKGARRRVSALKGTRRRAHGPSMNYVDELQPT